MQRKPWGPLSDIEISMCLMGSAGAAIDVIRAHDPAWGYSGQKTFEVTVIKEEKCYYEAKVRVAAPDADKARDIVDKMPKYSHNFGCCSYGDDLEIYADQAIELFD